MKSTRFIAGTRESKRVRRLGLWLSGRMIALEARLGWQSLFGVATGDWKAWIFAALLALVTIPGRCADACLEVTCAPPKTVSCGSNWDFDPPSVTNTCCPPDTNYTLIVVSTVSTGACPQIITRTWEAVACGHTNMCSQTVTVVPSGPLLLCSNLTIKCGSPIPTNAPEWIDVCCTNVVVSLIDSVTQTNGCTNIISQTWLAVDCCSNTATCTRTVTIIPPPVLVLPGITLNFTPVLEGGVEFSGGDLNFLTVSGAQFQIDSVGGGIGDSVGLLGSFLPPGPFAIGAITTPASGIETAPLTGSPTLQISDSAGFDLSGMVQWPDITTLGTGGIPNVGGHVNVTGITYGGGKADLQALAASGTARLTVTFEFDPAGTLTQIKTGGGVTAYSGTIEGVDTTSSTIHCVTSKTVHCGTDWTFDKPTPADTCCTNLTVLPLSTVTNGLCPELVTRIWEVIDCCGRTNQCSQTVVVVNTNPPVLNCSNLTIVCGSTALTNPPEAVSRCCGELSVSLIDSVTNSAGCTNVILQTWLAIDCCSNAAVCTRLVTVIPPPPILLPGITLNYSPVLDGGIEFNTGAFGFLTAAGAQFQIDSELGGSGAIGLGGSLLPSGPFAIGAITTLPGGVETAPVTGTTTLHITDAFGVDLTGVVQWTDITTLGTGGILNVNGILNLTGLTYAGLNADLQALAAAGSARLTVAFHFIPARTLAQLKASGGLTDYSGTIEAVATASSLITCATNKTVSCGGSWGFDPPTPVGLCCTNPTILVLSTVTNGVCPQLITRVWEVIDCCGITNHCSQTVAVEALPPIIQCPSNIVLSSRLPVPVTYQVTAEDGCGGTLPVTCTPPSGSLFSPGQPIRCIVWP